MRVGGFVLSRLGAAVAPAIGAAVVVGIVLGSQVRSAAPALAGPDAETVAGAASAAKRARRVPPLKIRKLTPRHGAKFVPLDASVVVRFSGAVDPATITPGNVVLRRLLQSQAAEWTVAFEDRGRRAVLTPKKPFEPGADYEVVIGPGIARADGGALNRTKRAIFFTDPRFSPYTILRPDQFADVDDTMVEPRAAHSATTVSGSRILLAGGLIDAFQLARGADLFDPYSNEFRSAGTLLRVPRAYHQAVTFAGGSSLLIGGWDGNGALASTEYFDRSTSGITPGPVMAEARDFHAAVTLKDGRILVTGGLSYDASGRATYSDTAEIMDTTFRWRPTSGRPLRRRAGHTLSLLPDGTVLVVGGISPNSGFGPLAEIFDPATETFRYATNANRQHRQLHTAVAIDGGEHILLADGGDAIVEIYDPATERFEPAGGSSFANRTRATASLLPTGDVIVAGGFEQRGADTIFLQTIDIYLRTADSWGRIVPAGVVFKEPRAGHTASTLSDGRILFAGGFGQDASLDTGVIFTPDPPKTPAK